MSWYEYEGLTPGGTAITGRIEAADHEQATRDLALMQIQVRQLRPASAPAPAPRLSADDLIFFNEQLASLAKAGIALDEGLAQLARDLESSRLKHWILDLVEDLRRGMPLDQAIAARQQGLPILYSRAIRAGIQTGNLAGTLLNLNQHLRLAGDTRRLVWEMTSYPLLIAVLGLSIVSFFFVLVVPQFKDIFRDFGTQLPAVTCWMIGVADIYPQILLVGGVAIGLLVLLWRALRYSAAGRAWRERILLALPLIGHLTRSSLIARFLRMIATTVDTGVPLPEALRLAADATGSRLLASDAERLVGEVERGQSIFVATQSARLVPPLFGYCVQVATGREALPAAVAHLARAYENRAFHALAMIRVVLFPLLVLLLGGIILLGVVAMFLPLVSLINAVSGGG